MNDESMSGRDRLEQLAESFVTRFRAGERPSVEEYAARFPDQAGELRELLRALVLLEQIALPKGTTAFRKDFARQPIPSEIGDFTIVREIARGGMGVVYEAIQRSLGRHVALKVLALPDLQNPAHLERFRLEARAAARLHHTHIVPVFDVGEHNGLHYYAMQFIQGQSLDLVIDALRKVRRANGNKKGAGVTANEFTQSDATSLLSGRSDTTTRNAGSVTAGAAANGRETGSSEPRSGSHSSEFTTSHTGREFYRSVARVGLQVAEALSYAHSEGILHRDIKPSNLLLDASGNVWVTDFGLAKAEGTEGLTHAGDFVGTLRYMPPERLEGWSDRRSDLYSLGAALYELVTLRPFLETDSRGKLVDMILHSMPAAPSRFDPQIPRNLETIILKAIGKEPAARYRSADEMAEDLRLYLADRPVRARRSTPVEQFVRWCRRSPLVAALVFTVAATLMIGTIVSSYFAASASREAAAAVRSRDEADHQRQRAELVNQFFMNEVFGQADPNVFKRAGISLVQALDTAADNIDTKFPDDPELRAMLQTRLGQIYSAMDEYPKAVKQLRSAATEWERVAGELDPRTLVCRRYLGKALFKTGNFKDGKPLLESTLADQTKVLGPNHEDTLQTAVWYAYCLVSLKDKNDIEQTKQSYQQSRAALGARHPITLEAEYSYSWVLRWHHRTDEALEPGREAVAGLREAVGSDDIRTMYASYNYAACLQSARRFKEAAVELRLLYDTRKRVLGPTHIDTIWAAWRLSEVLTAVGEDREAAAVQKEMLAHLPPEKIEHNAFVLNASAWMIATSQDGSLRDNKRMLEMATKACELTRYKNSNLVDTLATATAECGDRAATLEWSHRIFEMSDVSYKVQYYNALRFLWCDDVAQYHQARSAMVEQFSTSTGSNTRYWVAWTCALGPAAIDDFAVPRKFADELAKSDPMKASNLELLGMLDYRTEHFEEAARRSTAAIVAYKSDASGKMSPLYSQFFLAMANWKLGKRDDARKTLRDAQAGMDQEIQSRPPWPRRATLELFRHEAESLIRSDDTAPNDAKKSASPPQA